MSLLARIQAAEANGQKVTRGQGVAVEAIRKRCRERLAEEEALLGRLVRDEVLMTVFGDVMEGMARDERLERLGGYLQAFASPAS